MNRFLCDHDLHAHTLLSSCCHDERQTAEAIIQHAIDNHYSVQCITDHLWDPAVPGGSPWYQPQNIDHVRRLLPLPQSTEVRVVFGCETEFCGGETLGLKPEHFSQFQFVIIPPNHFHMVDFVRPAHIETPEQTAELFCKRLEEISCLPIPFHKVGIAHMTTGLIYKGKNKYDVIECINRERFFDIMRTFAQKGAGIELNGACFKRDIWQAHEEIELRLYRIAKDAGCKFYLGTDAHSIDTLDRITHILPEVVQRLQLNENDRYHIPE